VLQMERKVVWRNQPEKIINETFKDLNSFLILHSNNNIMEKKELQDKPLNEQESMELITRMIQNTQRKLERGTGNIMLLWGYATVFTTILVWAMITYVGSHRFGYLWYLIPVIGITGLFLRKKRPKEVRTYVDKVITYIWVVLGGTGFLLSTLSIWSFMWTLPILFIVIIIMGMGSTLTGLVIEFKPSIIGGIIGVLLSAIQVSGLGYDIKMFSFALAFLVMYVIPGHILNYRAKKACSEN